MSNSVVPAAAATQAKQLVRNKKLVKRADDQKHVRDDQSAADKDDDAVHAVQADHHHTSMSDTSLSGDFTFAGALAAAAGDSASLVESSAQDEGGSVGDDGDGIGGTAVAVGAVVLAGLGVAVLVGGGSDGDDNEAPVVTSAAAATIAENSAITTQVYKATATDADNDTLTYKLGGADAAAFNIDAASGVVTLKASADFETKSTYNITVTANDGTVDSAAKAVVVTVTDVAENAAPVVSSAATATIDENLPAATQVYKVTATDANAADVLTYKLSGTDAAAFNIDAATGVVTLKAPADFETKSSYTFDVQANDGKVDSAVKTVTLTVNDLVEAPTAAIAISGTGTNNDSDAVATTYTVANPGGATYQYTITDFDLDDKIVVPNGGAVSIINSDFNDGKLIVQIFSNGQNAQLVLDGLTPTEDAITSVTKFNDVYGPGSIA
jgi:hypothetical protein